MTSDGNPDPNTVTRRESKRLEADLGAADLEELVCRRSAHAELTEKYDQWRRKLFGCGGYLRLEWVPSGLA